MLDGFAGDDTLFVNNGVPYTKMNTTINVDTILIYKEIKTFTLSKIFNIINALRQ